MLDGENLSRILKNIPMPKNSSRIGMMFAQGQFFTPIFAPPDVWLMIDGEEGYMQLNDFNSEMV